MNGRTHGFPGKPVGSSSEPALSSLATWTTGACTVASSPLVTSSPLITDPSSDHFLQMLTSAELEQLEASWSSHTAVSQWVGPRWDKRPCCSSTAPVGAVQQRKFKYPLKCFKWLATLSFPVPAQQDQRMKQLCIYAKGNAEHTPQTFIHFITSS